MPHILNLPLRSFAQVSPPQRPTLSCCNLFLILPILFPILFLFWSPNLNKYLTYLVFVSLTKMQPLYTGRLYIFLYIYFGLFCPLVYPSAWDIVGTQNPLNTSLGLSLCRMIPTWGNKRCSTMWKVDNGALTDWSVSAHHKFPSLMTWALKKTGEGLKIISATKEVLEIVLII